MGVEQLVLEVGVEEALEVAEAEIAAAVLLASRPRAFPLEWETLLAFFGQQK